MSDLGKDPGYHVGDGGSGRRSAPPRTDFEYGSGGRSLDSNVDGPGVHEGTTEAYDELLKYKNDPSDGDRSIRSEGSVTMS